MRTTYIPNGSACWNGLVVVKDNIALNSKWSVVNEKGIYFWKDCLLREKTLETYGDINKVAHWSMNHQGYKVANYIQKYNGI